MGATPKGWKTHKGIGKNPHDEEAKRDADRANNRQVKTKEGAKSHGLAKNKSLENHKTVGKQQNVRNDLKRGGKN